jgi:hypothetical protein
MPMIPMLAASDGFVLCIFSILTSTPILRSLSWDLSTKRRGESHRELLPPPDRSTSEIAPMKYLTSLLLAVALLACTSAKANADGGFGFNVGIGMSFNYSHSHAHFPGHAYEAAPMHTPGYAPVHSHSKKSYPIAPSYLMVPGPFSPPAYPGSWVYPPMPALPSWPGAGFNHGFGW